MLGEQHALPICHPDRSRSDDRSEASGGIPTMRIAPCRLREFSRIDSPHGSANTITLNFAHQYLTGFFSRLKRSRKFRMTEKSSRRDAALPRLTDGFT